MYRTETLLRRNIRVHYPEGSGRMVLRTDLDWDQDIAPEAVSADGATSTFTLEAKKPFVYFKPVLLDDDSGMRWSVGANMLLTMTTEDVADVFPHFDGSDTGSYSPLIERDSSILGRKPHDEKAWGKTLHLPVQLGIGTATTTQRRRRG